MSNRNPNLKKIQPKLKPLPFIIIGVVIVAVVAMILLLKDSPQEAFYKEYTNHGAYQLAEKHVYKEISYKEFNKKLKAEEKMIVYFGTPTCQSCVEEVPVLNTEFNEMGLDENFKNIYYIDVRKLKDKQLEVVQSDYYYTEEEPLILYFEDGEVKIDRYFFGSLYAFVQQVKGRQN